MLTPPPQTSPEPVPAAWPSGVSSLAQAMDACQRPDAHKVPVERQARTSKAIQRTPGFRRNAVEVAREKATKER